MQEGRKNTKRSVKLSERMACVAGMVTPGGCVCDIGCDHGFVSIFLIQNDIARKVYAMDVGEGPLERARTHIDAYGLEDRIETRLSDGLSMITEEDPVDTAIMAGMGGILIEKIMKDAMGRGLFVKEFVLQPQSGWEKLRAFLRRYAYQIIQEDMILEDGKYYPVMKVQGTKASVIAAQHADGSKKDAAYNGDISKEMERPIDDRMVRDLYGGLLLDGQHPVLLSYLQKEQAKFLEIKKEMAKKNMENTMVLRQIEMIEKALSYYTL